MALVNDTTIQNVAEANPGKPKKDLAKYDVPIVSRKEWNAVPPTSEERLPRPVEYVFLTVTNTASCRGRQECSETVQRLQTHYMQEKGLADIPYNFLIGEDGTLLEGRGWTTLSHQLFEDHLDIWKDSMDIAFIQDYSLPVTDELKQAAYGLIRMGVRRKHIERLHVVDICRLYGTEDMSLLGADETEERNKKKTLKPKKKEVTNLNELRESGDLPPLVDEKTIKRKKKKGKIKQKVPATPNDNANTGEKKKRGRRKKVEVEDDPNVHVSGREEFNFTGVFKKRGRGKKVVLDPNVKEQEEENLSPTVPVKKTKT